MVRQEYDKNTIQIKGTLSKVYRRDGDVFALMSARSVASIRTRTLLRIDGGKLNQTLVPLKQGMRVQVFGHLYPEEYAISVMQFLKLSLSNQKEPASYSFAETDLAEWSDVFLTHNNPAIAVHAIAFLDDKDNVMKSFGKGFDPRIDNKVFLEGVVAKQWDYPPVVDGKRFVRIATYDRYCAPDPGQKTNGNRRLPRQQAHYYNVLIPDADRDSVALRKRIFVEGSFENYSQQVTLRKALEHTNQDEKVRILLSQLPDTDWLDQVSLSRRINYIHAQAITIYDE